MPNKFKINKKTFLIIFMIIIGVVFIPIGYSYYTASGSIYASSEIALPDFIPMVNGSSNMNQSISLASTITNNKSLAPGAIGKFKVDLNFSNIGANAYYKIEFDRYYLPDNLRLYIDEGLTTEIDSIEGVHYLSNSNNVVEHFIYWKWIYEDTQEANENDNGYMGSQLDVDVAIYISQTYEDHDLVLVNDFQIPTGRISLSGNYGSFNTKLDFSKISGSTSYNVFFDKETVGDVHLYSDSEYQNEVTSLSGTFDGTTSIITTPLYWRCEGTCSNGGLYYIVYLS